MKILYKKPGLPPEVREIENELKVYQELVEGYIEVVRFGDYCLIVNEEGWLKNLQHNFYMEAIDQMIYGPAVFTRLNEARDDFAGMNDNDIKWIRYRLGWRC